MVMVPFGATVAGDAKTEYPRAEGGGVEGGGGGGATVPPVVVVGDVGVTDGGGGGGVGLGAGGGGEEAVGLVTVTWLLVVFLAQPLLMK
jgi:hypothetical protein